MQRTWLALPSRFAKRLFGASNGGPHGFRSNWDRMQNVRQISLDLDEIAALLEFSGASKFKVNAYRRAAQVVNALGDELGVLVEQNRLREFEGIGAALSRQIEELWNSGSSELLARLRGEQPEGATELMQVQGLSPKRVRALHAALGIRSVEELCAACAAERVRTVKGFGAKTEARLAAAAKRWLERDTVPSDPMLLARALELAELLRMRLLGVAEEVHLVGDLRRGEETVREIEFVVVGDAERALRHVSSLRQVLRIDRSDLTAALSPGVRLKLHAVESASLGNALVFATGNAAHVNAVLERARERHVAIDRVENTTCATSEVGARSSFAGAAHAPASAAAPRAIGAATCVGQCFSSEAALYRVLGCNFVPAELRAGRSELEDATSDDFADLIDFADIQGMVHCHTTYSDGRNSVIEMARAAHILGMKYITITDHSPSAHYARGVSVDRLKAQWDEIAAAQEQIPIRILRGIESDILADGSLDFPDSILERFEVVIASIHARYRMDGAAMTARLSRALSLPIFKIWGHGLGRILNHRNPIECDVPALLDVLEKAPGAIEINADPHRLDLAPAWLPAARARGIPFVISADAHSVKGFGVLRYGITMARRGGVRRTEVLNTFGAEEFVSKVRPT